MNNIEKLIENGGWLPIEDAPKDGSRILVKDGFGHYVVKWANSPGDGVWLIDAYQAGWVRYATHFMPLDTPERMAKVIEKQYQTIESLRNRLSVYDCQEQVDEADTLQHLQNAYVYACEALVVIDKIAGGENA